MLVSLAWASGVAAVLAGRRRLGTARWRSLLPPWMGALLVALAAVTAAAWTLGQPAAPGSSDSAVAASLVAVGAISLCAAVGVAVLCRVLGLLLVS